MGRFGGSDVSSPCFRLGYLLGYSVVFEFLLGMSLSNVKIHISCFAMQRFSSLLLQEHTESKNTVCQLNSLFTIIPSAFENSAGTMMVLSLAKEIIFMQPTTISSLFTILDKCELCYTKPPSLFSWY